MTEEFTGITNEVWLIDIDNVLADFEGGFIKEWVRRHPEIPFVPLEERVHFYIRDDYSEELRPLVEEIHHYTKGFYANLPVVDGAIDALYYIKNCGKEIFLCSKPSSINKFSMIEKYEWVDKNLGPEWSRRIILTRDKTLVLGHILIDDKPDILHRQVNSKPSWEHIIFDMPYNRPENIQDPLLRDYIATKKRINWKNYKEVLNI